MRFVCCLAGMIAITAGCRGVPATRSSIVKPRLADRDAVAKALPPGHTLDQVIKADFRSEGGDGKPRFENPVTLEEKLAEVGARVDGDGRLQDAAGKEIHFEPSLRIGCQIDMTPFAKARLELEKKYRVIDIDTDPGGPAPP